MVSINELPGWSGGIPARAVGKPAMAAWAGSRMLRCLGPQGAAEARGMTEG